MASERVRELKALLDRLVEQAEFDSEPTTQERVLREEAMGCLRRRRT